MEGLGNGIMLLDAFGKCSWYPERRVSEKQCRRPSFRRNASGCKKPLLWNLCCILIGNRSSCYSQSQEYMAVYVYNYIIVYIITYITRQEIFSWTSAMSKTSSILTVPQWRCCWHRLAPSDSPQVFAPPIRCFPLYFVSKLSPQKKKIPLSFAHHFHPKGTFTTKPALHGHIWWPQEHQEIPAQQPLSLPFVRLVTGYCSHRGVVETKQLGRKHRGGTIYTA